MSTFTHKRAVVSGVAHRVARLGTRTLTGLATALIAAVLLFASPEIGIFGAIGGVMVGGISALLMRPHHTM